jgi:hypothetical protein
MPTSEAGSNSHTNNFESAQTGMRRFLRESIRLMLARLSLAVLVDASAGPRNLTNSYGSSKDMVHLSHTEEARKGWCTSD